MYNRAKKVQEKTQEDTRMVPSTQPASTSSRDNYMSEPRNIYAARDFQIGQQGDASPRREGVPKDTRQDNWAMPDFLIAVIVAHLEPLLTNREHFHEAYCDAFGHGADEEKKLASVLYSYSTSRNEILVNGSLGYWQRKLLRRMAGALSEVAESYVDLEDECQELLRTEGLTQGRVKISNKASCWYALSSVLMRRIQLTTFEVGQDKQQAIRKVKHYYLIPNANQGLAEEDRDKCVAEIGTTTPDLCLTLGPWDLDGVSDPVHKDRYYARLPHAHGTIQKWWEPKKRKSRGGGRSHHHPHLLHL